MTGLSRDDLLPRSVRKIPVAIIAEEGIPDEISIQRSIWTASEGRLAYSFSIKKERGVRYSVS